MAVCRPEKRPDVGPLLIWMGVNQESGYCAMPAALHASLRIPVQAW